MIRLFSRNKYAASAANMVTSDVPLTGAGQKLYLSRRTPAPPNNLQVADFKALTKQVRQRAFSESLHLVH